jgi:hypothetical protein
MNEEKITIIEGPPPTFELVNDIWANGIVESPALANVAVTNLRTANGPALVERCYRAWNNHDSINLEFRGEDGLTLEVPIVAARATETKDGQLLFLWVRLPSDDFEVDFEYRDIDGSDFGEDDEDEDPPDQLF